MAFQVGNTQGNNIASYFENHTYNFTVGANDNLLVIMFFSPTGGTNSTVTYDGDSMTKEYDDGLIEVWSLANPSTGSNEVALSTSAQCQCLNASIEDAKTGDPIDVHNYESGSSIQAGTDIDDTITTTVEDAILIEQIYTSGNTSLLNSPSDSQTRIGTEGSYTSYEYTGAYKVVSSSGSQDLGWDIGGTYPPYTYSYGHTMVAIQKAATQTNDERGAKLTGGYGQKQAQSNEVASPGADISKAVLMPDQSTPSDSSITWYLSANGGTDWESVTPNSEHTFTDTGQSLKWRAVMNPSTDKQSFPDINKVVISYKAISGTATSDERDAIITGVATTSAERAAILTGKLTANSERGATMDAVAGSNDERGATTHGVDSANDERDAVITGKQTDNSERAGRLTGGEDVNSERGATTHGAYRSPQYLYWSKINSGSNNINQVVVHEKDVTTPSGSSIAWHVSANGGSDWEAVTKEVAYSMIASGNDLRLRATLTRSTDKLQSPTLDRISIVWTERVATEANSERSAVLTGGLSVNDARSAILYGKDATNSERSAIIIGQDSTDDERGAILTGGEEVNDERDAIISGKESTNSERDAVIAGQDSDSDERAGHIVGKDTSNSERPAILTGQDTTADERAGIIRGKQSTTNERDAKVVGKDSASENRDAIVTGTLDTNDERPAIIAGKQSTNNERAATLFGGDSASEDRDAVISGQDTANDERAGHIYAKDTTNSERSGKLEGTLDQSDIRNAKTRGKTTASSEIDAVVRGSEDVSGEVNATIHGVDTTTDEIDVIIKGKLATYDEILAKILGKDTTTSERDAVITGQEATAEQIFAHLFGKDTTASERYGHLYAVFTEASERGAKLTGRTDISKPVYLGVGSEGVVIGSKNDSADLPPGNGGVKLKSKDKVVSLGSNGPLDL